MEVNQHRALRHHDDRDLRAAAPIAMSQPSSSMRRHGGVGRESIVNAVSSSVGSPPTTTAPEMSHVMLVGGSVDMGGSSGEEYASYKQKNKARNTTPDKESQMRSKNNRGVIGASWWSRRLHQRNLQRQQQQQPQLQQVTRLYYPFLIVLLIMSFLSMSFSPFLVYNFLPDHQTPHPASFTLDPLLSSPLLEQQFHPNRMTTTATNAADSEIHAQREKHNDSPVQTYNVNASSSSFIIRPLRPGIDYEQYTVRINTWKRPAQLRVVLDHLSSKSCRSSIAQVQVIWCLAQGPVPEWLLQFNQDEDAEVKSADFVVVEAHTENSLNERFNVLLEPPTFGILTVDDDVLRPCLALDAAFVKWTRNPHRMVGFDARSHVVSTNTTANTSNGNVKTEQVWAYGYLSTTQNMNRYSSSLTRFAFIHVDYLYSYMTDMPAQIRQVVAENLNCEDIAMSFWISKQASLYTAAVYSSLSSLAGSTPPPPPQPPLLADLWVMESQVKLATGGKSISAGKSHKKMRDACVNDFANWLQLKGRLRLMEWVHFENATEADATSTSNHLRVDNMVNRAKKSVFECGAPMDVPIAEAASEHVGASLTARVVKERIDLWADNMQIMLQDLKQMSSDTRRVAKNLLFDRKSQASIKK